MVVGVTLRSEEITEHSSKVGNVGLGLELQGAAVRKVLRKLTWAPLAQRRDGNTLLLLHNQLVLLGGRLGFQSLPWESSLEEIDKNISDGLEIISSRLLNSQVIVDRSVTRGTGEGSSFALGDVLKSTRVSVSLRETEIDTINEVTVATASVGDKVGRFDITMDQVARMHQFNTFKHLVSNHENRFQREPPSAFVELIFQRGTEQIHDHKIVRILCSEVVDLSETRGVLQFTVHLVFVTKLGAPCSMFLELYSDLNQHERNV